MRRLLGILLSGWVLTGFGFELRITEAPLSEVLALFSAETTWSVSQPAAFDPMIRVNTKVDEPLDGLQHIAKAAGLEVRGEPPRLSLVEPAVHTELLSIDLKHREASHVLELIQSSGLEATTELFIIADPETNRLLISGHADHLVQAKRLIEVLDVEVAQILIEAKLVAADTSLRRDLGVRWSFATAEPGRSGASGQSGGAPLDSTAGALSLAFVSDPRLLSLELQALEASGAGEVISEPRIVTTNRRPATIRQGEQLPFVTVDENGQSRTEFKDAVLELKVTPILRDDGRIEMTLDIRQDQVSQLATAQGPAIETRELNTRVTVDPGETLVLGGIYESKEEEIETGIPGLSAIPILGRIFQTRQHRAFKSELLVFISPRVL